VGPRATTKKKEGPRAGVGEFGGGAKDLPILKEKNNSRLPSHKKKTKERFTPQIYLEKKKKTQGPQHRP